MQYQPLSTTAQNAYAQLLDAATAESLTRSAGLLKGNFQKRAVSGRDYWYFHFRQGSRYVQHYVGPDEPRVRALVESKRAAPKISSVAALASGYAGYGGTTLPSKHLRLLIKANEYGFFRAGGILVGTHCFAGYANLLGVQWISGDKTMDIDLAVPGKNLSIAVPDAPKTNLHDALSTFESGFLPIPTAKGRAGATYVLKGEADFQVDFLTTFGRGRDEPIEVPQLAVTAQPLKFLDYLLEHPTQLVVLDPSGRYCLVTVPSPARYAIHKLIVHGERPQRARVKALKDLLQAATLIDYFQTENPAELKQAWTDALGRGPNWRTRLKKGVAELKKRHSCNPDFVQ
ncbi:MAG: nucleotidyltransferase domain-containing protein [Pseudomonadota bacterium]